jgi:ABC-type oligopeptide transport system substrate-binding subunit
MAAGFGSPGKLRRRCLTLTALFTMATALLLLPACGTKSTSTTTSSGTPKNTYSFTLNASDANAMAPSNGTQTVSLTVN